MTDVLAERLQAILDWADLALANPDKFNAHGVKNLDGPVFDEARAALNAALTVEPEAGEAVADTFARGFVTCNSDGQNSRYEVVAKFRTLKEAQNAHGALVDLIAGRRA